MIHRIIGALWGALLLLPAYWLWWPVTPVVYLEESTVCRDGVDACSIILNEHRHVAPGEPIRFLVHVQHLTRGVPVTVTAEMEGPEVRHFPQFRYVTSGSVSHFANSSFRVPFDTEPGIYVLSFSSCFHMNPLRTLCRHRETQPFRVTRKN